MVFICAFIELIYFNSFFIISRMNRADKIRQLLCFKQKWVNQKQISKCQGCQKSFVPLFVWRHHCRFCGRVFCSDCVANIMTGQSIGYNGQKKLRHCNPCKLRIEMVVNANQNKPRQSQLRQQHFKEHTQKISIEDPDMSNSSTYSQRKTEQKLRSFIIQQKMALQQVAISFLRQLACDLCVYHGLEVESWKDRLAEIAWKAALETKPQIFIRRTPFCLSQQIKIVTLIAPPDSVTAVCVKGLVLQKNIPSRNLQMHLKYPRMVTIRPAISADSLTQNKSLKFDELVNNVDNILKTCLGQVFKLNPNIMFVQEQVNQVAVQLALQKKIMIISKVKGQDLQKIQRLSGIRKRIQNFFTIDRQQVSEIIGCCERIYFKTVRQGQMLMFIEHDIGIRTVLLGDSTESSNAKLKKVFNILLKAAWNLKAEREIIVRDAKLCSEQSSEADHLAVKEIRKNKYKSIELFLKSQQHLQSKMIFSFKKAQTLSKPFQEYIKKKRRKGLYGACGDTISRKVEFYEGNQLSLGNFLLKLALQNMCGCENCGSQHAYCYFNDESCITILNELTQPTSKLFFSQNIEQDAQFKKIIQSQYIQSFKLFQVILKFMNLQGLQYTKIQFLMSFQCQDCGLIIGNIKQNIGNDFLLMNLNHFLCVILSSASNGDRFKQRQKKQASSLSDLSQNQAKIEEQKSCLHLNISRVFEFLRSRISFTINRIDKYYILPIVFNEPMVKKVAAQDQNMVAQLFKKLLTEKFSYIQSLQTDMERLPFSAWVKGSVVSFSISGTIAQQHPFFQPFLKIQSQINEIKSILKQMDENIMTYIQDGRKDWTVTLRKYAKIDHLIKILAEMIYFITNSIKKQKIQQTVPTTSNLATVNEEQASQKGMQVSDFNVYTNPLGYTETNISDSQSVSSSSKTASLVKTNSFAHNFMKMKKETSSLLDPQFDHFMKTMKKKRYLKFQGSYLYYPIAAIDDAVSLLSCFLNSEEFKDSLKQSIYKDNIELKLPFTREMKHDSNSFISAKLIYKNMMKEDYFVGDGQDIAFAVYHHKCFEEIRISQGINFRLFVKSLYSCQSWDSSGGKSNSTFSKANNQTLVVKIINQKQFVQFQKFAPAYLKYMKHKRKNGSESYLAKIYGIYEVHIKRQVYKCVVMQNLFFGLDTVHKVYDLKGSEVNRLAAKGTGLDTNFIIDKDGYPYLLQPEVYDKTIAALTEDANFLKEQGVIDYSLLVIESGLGLRMAIIDFMRPYHFVQKIQTIYKEIKSGKDPTVIPPPQYAQRFIRAMHRYFAKAGACCS